MPRAHASGLRPSSPFLSIHEGRKRFKRLETSGLVLHGPPHHAFPSGSGVLDALCDEVIVEIMYLLAKLPGYESQCLNMRSQVLLTARHLRSLILTCRRMVSVYETTACLLKLEMAARSATQITPSVHEMLDLHPFTAQLHKENRSRDQLTSLKEGMAKMAVHCAGPCCDGARSELNLRRKRIYTGVRQSATCSASVSGDHCFVSYRSRNTVSPKQRGSRRAESGVQRRTEWLARLERPGLEKDCVRETSRVELDVSEYSAPHSMRASQCGRLVAMIRSVHTTTLDTMAPHASVFVWDSRQSSIRSGIAPPDEAFGMGAINAQDAWWTGEAGELRLSVLWSTAYVHPIGTVVGANSDTCCYFFSQHAFVDASWELTLYSGPFAGKAQTASPSADGSRVAVLVRKPRVGNGPASLSYRATMFHTVNDEGRVEISHRDGIGMGRGIVPIHPHDAATCPSAVGLSPLGDCIVAIHRRYFSVVAEILICTALSSFVSVQTIDLTHWISVGRSETDIVGAGNSLKLPYNIVFSPCGRFAAIIDQRVMFGLTVANHSMVVLDLGLRHERRGVRALPLGSVEDVAPRSVEWTRAGMWLQPRHGALFVRA